MGINTSTKFDHAGNNSHNTKFKSFYFFAGFVIVSFIAAFIVGGIILGKNKSNKQQAATEIKEQVKLDSSQLPNNPDKWTVYQIKATGIELKLPESLTKKEEWKEQVIPASDKGSIVCFSNENSEGAVCHGDILFAGGTSTDFSEGRGGTFTDLQGFTKENEKYFIKTTGGSKFELTNAKFREINNLNGVKIIKLLGENEISEGNEFPKTGTPGEGYLGAIANTNNSKYPGIAIQLKLDEEISEYEFDQILESIKFIENE